MRVRNLAGIAALALASLQSAAAETQGFSFDYTITGDRAIAPYQVFDDGSSMFLQFRDPARVPSIFVRGADGAHLVAPQQQGHYLVVTGLAHRLEFLSDDRKTAAVTSTTRKAPAKAPLAFVPANRSATGIQAASSLPVAQPTQPVIRPVQSVPAPLYARRVAESSEVAAVAIQHARPSASPEVTQLRSELDQMRRVLESIAERLESQPFTPGPNYAPVNYEMRQLNVRAAAPPVKVATGTRPIAVAQAFAGNGHGVDPQPVLATAAAPAPATGPRIYSFKVDAGQRLSEAVRQFVGAQGLELDWDTGGADYEIKFGFSITGGTVEEALFGALSPFKLNAHTRRGNNVVAVTRAS